MHECPYCGMACDCDGDGEDLWQPAPEDCQCPCEDEDEEGFDSDWDQEDDPEEEQEAEAFAAHVCEECNPLSCPWCQEGTGVGLDPDLNLANCLHWELPEALHHRDGTCDSSACFWCRRQREGKP